MSLRPGLVPVAAPAWPRRGIPAPSTGGQAARGVLWRAADIRRPALLWIILAALLALGAAGPASAEDAPSPSAEEQGVPSLAGHNAGIIEQLERQIDSIKQELSKAAAVLTEAKGALDAYDSMTKALSAGELAHQEHLDSCETLRRDVDDPGPFRRRATEIYMDCIKRAELSGSVLAMVYRQIDSIRAQVENIKKLSDSTQHAVDSYGKQEDDLQKAKTLARKLQQQFELNTHLLENQM